MVVTGQTERLKAFIWRPSSRDGSGREFRTVSLANLVSGLLGGLIGAAITAVVALIIQNREWTRRDTEREGERLERAESGCRLCRSWP